mmetsp:Transcript_10924/g.26225  ORF Transcript_10924/g.26225 Transcript_10924/m.26225 type:complete len:291 (-) Transcript_10924:355-1227(-)
MAAGFSCNRPSMLDFSWSADIFTLRAKARGVPNNSWLVQGFILSDSGSVLSAEEFALLGCVCAEGAVLAIGVGAVVKTFDLMGQEIVMMWESPDLVGCERISFVTTVSSAAVSTDSSREKVCDVDTIISCTSSACEEQRWRRSCCFLLRSRTLSRTRYDPTRTAAALMQARAITIFLFLFPQFPPPLASSTSLSSMTGGGVDDCAFGITIFPTAGGVLERLTVGSPASCKRALIFSSLTSYATMFPVLDKQVIETAKFNLPTAFSSSAGSVSLNPICVGSSRSRSAIASL